MQVRQASISRRQLLKNAAFLSALGMGASLVPGLGGVARASGHGLTIGVGKLVTTHLGVVMLHSYISPEQGGLVTSQLIETTNSLTMVDTTFLPDTASEIRAVIEHVGKPVDRLIISHGHQDHFTNYPAFAEFPVFMLPSVKAELADPNNPAPVPEGLLENVQDLSTGVMSVDGVDFEFVQYDNAEALSQLVINVPEAGLRVLQDLMYTNVHFFFGMNRPNWLSILEDLQTDQTYTTLTAGHGMPTSRGEFDEAISYLSFFEAALTQSETADELRSTMQAEYPSYQGELIMGLWNFLFQGN